MAQTAVYCNAINPGTYFRISFEAVAMVPDFDKGLLSKLSGSRFITNDIPYTKPIDFWEQLVVNGCEFVFGHEKIISEVL